MEAYKNTDKQDLNGEIWKPIKGYKNYYVSNLGRIKVKTKSGNELIKKQCFSNGYLVLGLTKDGKQKTARVHRVVAEEFIAKPKNKKVLEVNHIDKHFETKYKESKNVIAYNKRGEYHYWITEKDLENKSVYIIDMPGIDMLINSKLTKKYDFKIVYVNCSIFKRIKNMLIRGETIKNIIYRLFIDYKQFKNWQKYKPIVINH